MLNLDPPPTVQGTIKFHADQFPQDVLQRMMAAPGNAPILKLVVPRLLITNNGMTMECMSGQPMTIEMDFLSSDLEITVAEGA